MKVQVHLRAEKLGNVSRGRWRGKKSNPYAKVALTSESTTVASSMVDLGCTEIIKNNLNPRWMTIFTLEHDESNGWTPLRITVHDGIAENLLHHSKENISRNGAQPNAVLPLPSRSVKEGTKMGEVDIEVGEILKMEGQEKKIDLNEGGSLFVHITKSQQGSDTGMFICHIRGLDIKNIESGLLGLGAIDPYFELSKKFVDPDHGITRWHVVYRSENIPNSINPYWSPFEIDIERLCNGDCQGKELKIAVWDYENWGEDRWLAEVEVSVAELRKSVTKGGNASRENALRVEDENEEVMGLLVVLKADIIS
ncbi:hypothetical protein ACHAXS_005452 [Conticribra weissflogii]